MRALILLMAVFSAVGVAQSPVPLHNGQAVTLHGTLALGPRGRLQFVTVKTKEAHVPMLDDGAGKATHGKVLHEIALTGYYDYELLYAHRGQTVTVSGTVMTDDASPYYRDNILLKMTRIVATDGTQLLGKQPMDYPVAADIGSYHAAAVLPADPAAPWRYSVEGGWQRVPDMLQCSSNGGGDVVNCSCATGFHPIKGDAIVQGKREEADVFKDMSIAQFGVTDEHGNENFAVTLNITCSR